MDTEDLNLEEERPRRRALTAESEQNLFVLVHRCESVSDEININFDPLSQRAANKPGPSGSPPTLLRSVTQS